MEDLLKLPKWAQRKIEVLEANLAHARKTLAAGPDDSDTFADPYGEVPRPLGTQAIVRLGGKGHDHTFDVRAVDGELLIQCNSFGGAMPALQAMSSNSFRIIWVGE